jgi:hypothetical protein
MATNSVDILGAGRASAVTGSRSGFYFGMAVVLAATVFIGFSPSFYLRAVLAKPLQVPPLSTAVLAVHGSVMTVWMLLVPAMTGLVKAGRVELHRRFGVFAAEWAVVVFCVVLVTAIVQAHRAVLAGTTTTSAPQKPAQFPSSAVFVFATKSADGDCQTNRLTVAMS